MYEITSEDEKKLAELSDYQQSILRILAEVPKEKITTYGDLAKDGTVGSFRGGAEGAVEEKTRMLRDEGVTVSNGKISLKKYRHKFK